MTAHIKHVDEQKVEIVLSIPMSDSMLKGEDIIQENLQEAGRLASKELLKRFDTDGSPITIGKIKLTTKGLFHQKYKTPHGDVDISRHLYQTSAGGPTFCPLEQDARIVTTSTPKLAKTITHKFSIMGVDEVKEDLKSNHHLQFSRGFIQRLADTVGTFAQAKEEHWKYSTPEMNSSVYSVGIGLDGTTLLYREGGYRIAMVGTVSLYNRDGERLHSVYIGAAPEYGKSTFLRRMTSEIEHVKKMLPKAKYVGIADGAKDNWSFLEQHTTWHITDFWHATQYLSSASESLFSEKQHMEREEWLEISCDRLKNLRKGPAEILAEMEGGLERKLPKAQKEKLRKAVCYFKNQKKRMHYSLHQDINLPIGSGVTEAACKTIIKQRLCQSGMRWKEKGASVVISLRCLEKSKRWEQFWNKVNRYGWAA